MNRAGYIILGLLLLYSCGGEDVWKQDRLNQRLLDAIYDNEPEKVDSCLKAGAGLEVLTMDGATPLILAASEGYSAIVKQLLDAGAEVDARRNGYYSSTALMEAAVPGDTASAKYLLSAGAGLSLRDTFGDPAINWGAYYGQVGYVSVLLDAGARWDVESQHGNALDIATKEWNLDLLDFFISRGAGEPQTDEEKILVKVVKAGDEKQVEASLENGLSPDTKDPLGMPILVWSAALGKESVNNILLQAGADPNAFDRAGQTPLSAAARFGHRAIADELLNAGARVGLAGERYQLTPLINAAQGGHVALAATLLDAGADIDHQDAQVGYTALMYAVAYGHRDLVRLFIEREANPYIKGKDGTGLYELIGLSGDEAISKMLEAYILRKQ